MLGACGNEGKLVTSQYFTTLQQMRVWICCIYQCIARVESKGTHRFMNPSKQRVEGNQEWERTKTEDPRSTKCMFQGQPGNWCGVHREGRSLHRLLPWLFVSMFLGEHFVGLYQWELRVWCFRGLVLSEKVASWFFPKKKKKRPCYLLFSKGFLFVFIKTTTLLWIQNYLLQSA